MRTWAIWWTMGLLAVGFSGCADEAPADSQDLGIDVVSKEGLGAIVGVVVDGSITPIAGAAVTLSGTEQETKTDEEGRFFFNDLQPGPYFVKATKPGYSEVQQSVDVVADVKKPPVLKVLLERLPGTEPFFQADSWTGFIECSLRAGVPPGTTGVGLNVCNGVGNQDVNHPIVLEEQPDFFQSEMVWESTQTLGSGLSLVAGPESCADVKYGRYDGPSPAILPLDKETLAGEGVGGEDAGICIRAFSWLSSEAADLAGVVISQQFQTITHHMYNFVPPEGWTFVQQGSPPLPA